MRTSKLFSVISRFNAILFIVSVLLAYYAIKSDNVLLWIFAMLAGILGIAADKEREHKHFK